MSIPAKSKTVIVFSESFDGRDFLRGRINELGLNAVCFEKEAICFDNMRPIAPKIVIVQTDSYQVAWRFVFAFYAMNLYCPLLIVSDLINANVFFRSRVNLPIFVISLKDQNDRLTRIISEMITDTDYSTTQRRLPLFLGETPTIRQIRSMIPSLADSRDALLVNGEKGCGKEHLIRLIVQLSKTENIFIKVDCGELSADILSNGWLKNILSTEARNTPVTLFLNGIELLSNQMQAEILLTMEALDNWKNHDSSDISWDVRFLSTSEVSIESMLEEGRFRKDLFYRLNVIPIHLPPLRTRKEDIELLMDYFIIQAAAKNGKCIMVPTQKARDILYRYDWPGNVEELKTYMKRVSIAGNELCIFANKNMPRAIKDPKDQFLKSASFEDLPKPQEIKNFLPKAGELSLKRICEEFVARTEKKLMQKALESTNWNRKKAAQLLNISYKSLLNKIKVYDII